MPPHVADSIAEVLRESQADKARFHLTALMHLQQRYVEAQARLDRAYDDRIAGRITEALWLRKSGSGRQSSPPGAARWPGTSRPATTTPRPAQRF